MIIIVYVYKVFVLTMAKVQNATRAKRQHDGNLYIAFERF